MNIEFKLPQLGENIENGDVVKVLVGEGDVIAPSDSVVELETDKAVVEIPCPYGGKVTKIHCGKGDTVSVGQTLLTIEESTESEKSEPPGLPRRQVEESGSVESAPARGQAPRLAVAEEEASIAAGPASRRLARELGVDLHAVSGSGKRGRITPEDVQAAATGSAPVPVTPPGEPGRDAWGPIRRERMSKIRRTIAAQMAKSAATIPHVTNFDDADVTDLEHLRKGVPPGYLGEGIKLTTMPFVLKAVAVSLRQHPAVNASLDDATEQVVYKEYVNIGVAVDTPRGLVVPAIRDVDRLSIPEIARELKTLAERARAAEFAIEDLRGGTFTISNLGAVGGTYSTPIINHPEVAILLLGRSKWRPAVRDGKIEPRLMMPLSLSFDHRLIDGAAAGHFLNGVIDLLQYPAKLLLTGGGGGSG
ncbi:MAG: 2-oxo acid dehydrogenase subunit E2 [Candidatus Nealsonbacteria bacterium]|nr:2-oxo acid dehydrogenase subunit E2 [Candidatus Nealsonbacteria bacterium]